MTRDEARVLISSLIEWYTEDLGERLGMSMCKETYMDALDTLWRGQEGELISRADAIEAVRKIVPVETEIDATLLDKAEVIVELSALPSAEAEQVTSKLESAEATRGEWEDKEVFNDTNDDHIVDEWQSARCSVCGKYHTTPFMYYFDNFNFCPNCGAKMKGADNEIY